MWYAMVSGYEAILLVHKYVIYKIIAPFSDDGIDSGVFAAETGDLSKSIWYIKS